MEWNGDCIHRGFGIDSKRRNGAQWWCNKESLCKHRIEVE